MSAVCAGGLLALVSSTVVLMAACQKTPEEPAPRGPSPEAAIPGATGSNAGSNGGRCVKPTPEAPPPAVAPGPAPGCPKDPEGPPMLPVVPVAFPDVRDVAPVQAELARTTEETQRGLMYRTKMAEGAGMLFHMGERSEHRFWMHNTCIPLDMLFVDDDGLIVGIVENVPTLNDEERTVGCPSWWVLEVNAGFSRRHGIKAGQHITIPAAAR